MRRERKRRRIIFIFAGVIGVCALFGGIVWLSWAPFLQITDTHITGTSVLQPYELSNVALADVHGKYLHLFSKANLFLYPKEKIRLDLLAAFPTIQSASVSSYDFHTIGISIVERQPRALWCGSAIDASTSCMLLDDSGLAYAPATSIAFASTTYETYYGALQDGMLPRQFLTPGEFHSLAQLIDSLAARQSPDTISSVYVDSDDDVYVLFASNFTLIFNDSDDASDVYDRFGLALQTDPFTSRPLSDFQYLDLRFGDKLFYKLKTASSTPTESQ